MRQKKHRMMENNRKSARTAKILDQAQDQCDDDDDNDGSISNTLLTDYEYDGSDY